MKLQLSLELLIYIALVSSAALASMLAFSRIVSSANSMASAYSIKQFISSLNAALILGNSSLSIFIPAGMCGASVSGQSLKVGNASYELVEPIEGNAFCPDESQAILNITYSNSYALLRR